ncbi:hypothetical protein AZE42_11400 [Rhizopogon vesiculosus]|uniref:Uncharacterized protein n=1 Tax=Rhizopogon vesiculosus TaxID=180088 RepID=A0A1J8QJ82_9AGAM|nr:hypothetical protein AZE42_11400 [Rhizopogon vesiculosus]
MQYDICSLGTYPACPVLTASPDRDVKLWDLYSQSLLIPSTSRKLYPQQFETSLNACFSLPRPMAPYTFSGSELMKDN